MEDIEQFREELHARVRVRASADSNFSHSAFAEVCGEMLEEAEEIFDFEPCYFRGKGSRNRNLAVDGFAIDDADKSMRLMIADFSGQLQARTITRTDARSAFGALIGFLDDSIRGVVEQTTEESSPEHGLARELRARSTGVSRYRCFLVTDDILSERVRDWPEGDVGGVPVEYHIWDAGRFMRAQLSRTGRDELIVDFGEVVAGGVPCLPAAVDAGTYEGYLCVLPGSALADIYERYGSRLLEGNVRSFLSTAGGVNRGIQQTLVQDPRMFFAFNNGISATASSVRTSDTLQGSRITSATDFQIVNGGQTTASLAHARRRAGADLSAVYVQMKLSVVSEEDAGALIPFISRYSNSQNKVSEADFFSNHEFHRQIEKISRRLRAPARSGSQIESFWFYERARGQHSVELNRRSAAERRRFELESPREQVITKTDLGKIENAWRRLPHEVCRGAQKNFVRFAEFVSKQWEQDPTRFHDEYFRNAVSKIILFRALEKLVPKEPWYDGGYRAQIVAYTIAKLVDLIEGEEGHGGTRRLDLEAIWKRQTLSPALIGQLRLIAAAAHKVILNPDAGIQNVGEWCKKEIAWRRLQAVRVELLPEFADDLVDPEMVAGRNRHAKTLAGVDAGLDALKEVIDFGSANWGALRAKAGAARAVTPGEDKLLRVAANPGWQPTDRQAKDLVRLRARLARDGIS
jgi:hypothetical protein